VPGKCASQFQEASEGDTATSVTSNLSAFSKALGRAMRLLVGCDQHVCVEECLPEYFGDHVVATITRDITAATNSAGESQLGDLTADAQRAVAGSDAAIVSPVSLCQDGADDPSAKLAFAATASRSADADGRVLWSEALATQYCYGGVSSQQPSDYVNQTGPGSAIVKVAFTGQQLYDALTRGLTSGSPLYVSGLTYTWQEASVPLQRKIVEIQKDGSPLDKAATFTVALSNYLAGAIVGENSPIPELTQGTGLSAVPSSAPLTLFGQYLSQLPQPVSPPTLDRITCQNCAAGSAGSGGGGP
jgi:5'-nucleotidase